MGPAAGATLSDWLRYQESLHPQAIALGLERVAEVAARLQLIPSAITTLSVAGTNGKGSSATLASLVLRESGHSVGLYTSPHLLNYSERVVIDGEAADDRELCRAFERIEQARQGTPLTYFEFGTLAALLLFRDAGVDVQVLEVGLGGRLDAVNIVDADVALVTSIGLDHQDWLGHTREQIGFEKAGLFRADRPAICSDPQPPLSIGKHARAIGARLQQLGVDFDVRADADHWRWTAPGQAYFELPMPGLPGAAQRNNAAGVIAALQGLSPRAPITETALRRALPMLRLPGRCEHRGRIILDVGHNAEAAAELAAHLRALPGTGRIWLVLGMLQDKPVESYAAALAPVVSGTLFAGLPGPRGLSAAALARRARRAGLDGAAYPEVVAALACAQARCAPDDWVVVAGSFLTVAAVAGQVDE